MNPGWYPDPSSAGRDRYFDGTNWTEQLRPSAASVTEPKTSGLAIVSLITSVLGLSLVAIICGHIARKQIRASAGAEKGSGLALAGLIIGYGQIIVVAAVVAVVVFLVGPSSDGVPAPTPVDEVERVEDEIPGTDSNPPSASLPAPPAGLTLTEATTCPPRDGSPERVSRFAGPPPQCIEPDAKYSAVFDTTEGDFTIALETSVAPDTVNNFVVLARYRYYDGVPFHRIVPDFVIQAGDGDGEPWGNNDIGYQIGDELPVDPSAYVDYSVAMANAGPDTNGSQFFVVLPGGGAQLQPLYSILGRVTEGFDTVDAIGELASADGQTPLRAVVINSVEIRED